MTNTSKKATTNQKPGKAIVGPVRRPDAPAVVAAPGDDIDRLDKMTLGELQKVFDKVTGESTRCPNKGYLVRSIREALATTQAEASSGAENEDTGSNAGITEPAATATLPTPSADATGAEAVHRPRHQKMGDELMVLPLRMKAEVVDELDAAWQRQGFQSRMALLRHVLRPTSPALARTTLPPCWPTRPDSSSSPSRYRRPP